MRSEQSPRPGAYWNLDVPLGTFTLSGRSQSVRLAAHTHLERFTDITPAINPLGSATGERQHILLRPYLPAQRRGGHAAIGRGQAWYYPAARTLVLWELLLDERFQSEHVLADRNMTTLWRGVEAVLLVRFPETTEIATPSWEPEYTTDAWRQFLVALGYRPHPTDAQTFTKPV